MNPKLKRLLRLSAFAVTGIGIVAGLAFVERSSDTRPVTELRVHVQGPAGVHFLDADAVRREVLFSSEGLLGTPLGRVDAPAIEAHLRGLPTVRKAEVYGTLDGVMHVKVDQRRPIIRVVNSDGSGFYIDDLGFTMPLSSTFTARVPVAVGELREPYAHSVAQVYASDSLAAVSWSDDLYALARFMAHDELWSALVDQVVVSDREGLVLIPRAGQQRILIGGADHLEEKFACLKQYYQKGLPQVGWRRHATVDLRFAGQVVCTRRPNS
ncbi:MAG: hypothetical protein JNM31_04520 [Flavobacteriales bacterium]|nr:hypothetical protein [Flavobacteriales bacterium]